MTRRPTACGVYGNAVPGMEPEPMLEGPNMRRRTLMTLLAALLLGLALVGCGGDDADEAVEEAETVAEGVAEEAEEAVETATGEAAEAVEDVTETAGEVVSEAEVSIELGEQNASGQSGTATLSPNDDGTVHVSLEISNPPAEAQPAHIHQGTCAELDPTPAFPLESVVNGTSESDVDVSLQDLLDAVDGYAINVHKSDAEADVYVACGDIIG
jgi:CHRD domain